MKAPAFQFYPQDFISSLDVQVMNVEQVGAYMLLLSNAWIHDPQGYLPNNERLLQMICRMNDKQWAKNKDLILKKFSVAGEHIFNQRLLKELDKQAEHRKKQAENGRKGGRPPKEKTQEEPNENPEKPTAFSGETQTKPKKSSSSSSSSSSSNNTPSTPAGAAAPNRHDAFLKEFNKITGRSFKTLDSKTKTQFDKLKKAGYQYSDFVTAITNGLEDSRTWQKPQLYTPEYITREANFSKYLNWKAIGAQSEYREPRAFNSIQEHYEYWGGSPAPKPEPSAA